jgi:hypothetical protein
MRFVSLTSGSLQIGGVHQLVFMARAKFPTETALSVDQNWSPTLIVSPCIAVFACFRMCLSVFLSPNVHLSTYKSNEMRHTMQRMYHCLLMSLEFFRSLLYSSVIAVWWFLRLHILYILLRQRRTSCDSCQHALKTCHCHCGSTAPWNVCWIGYADKSSICLLTSRSKRKSDFKHEMSG